MGDREMASGVLFAGTGINDEFVECARPGLKAKGRLFRKQILPWGSFTHPKMPGQKVVVDEKFAESLIRNFSNGACDIVQVPIVDGQNRHTEDPLRNLGQVVDLEVGDKGIYAIVDARDAQHADKLGKTLIGASAMMHLDYTDTRTGEHVGPTLLHMAVTNRPYLTKLEDFEEIVAASADTPSDTVLLGAEDHEEWTMDKDELIAALKDNFGIDVEALQEAAVADVTALSNVLGESDLSLTDVAEAVVELSQMNEDLSSTITLLAEERDALLYASAAREIDDLIRSGRILPKQRATMLALSMEDRDTFEALLPDDAIVSLSEDGVTTSTDSREDITQHYLNMIPNGNKQ